MAQPVVSFIGLGLMGRPMGHNLIKAGFPLVVWNRTAARADSLVAAGARFASSPREAAAAADVLITIVSDPPALEEVLWGSAARNGQSSDGAFAALKDRFIGADPFAVLAFPPEALVLQSAAFRLRPDEGRVAGAVRLAKAVAAGD